MGPVERKDAPPAVLVDHDNGVSTITLNRPERLNAVDERTIALLREGLAVADAEATTRVIVLTGAGRAFCAGGDVRNLGSAPASPSTVVHRDVHLQRAIQELAKPVVAMVNGSAVGLGLSLALACDVVLAAEDALLRDTHVLLGVPAGDGAVVHLLASVGVARTRQLLFRSAGITGRQAATMGIINGAFAGNELKHSTAILARQIADAPASPELKRIVNHRTRELTSLLLDTALAIEEIALASDEHEAAVHRFFAARAQRVSAR